MRIFKKIGGDEIPDLGAYVRDYVTLHKDVSIMVGCDAADSDKWNLRYATVVLLYHQGKGAHFLFNKDSVRKSSPKKMSTPDEIFQKIWGEVERTFEVAEYLEAELQSVKHCIVKPFHDGISTEGLGYKLVEAHVDINPDPAEGSHIVFNAAIGFFSGFGYVVFGKPRAWAASTAADMLLR